MSSIHPLHEFPQILRPPARLAALDIGTRTIGIALSTPDWQMATPLTTITRGKWVNDLAALAKVFEGCGVGGVVVGLPYHMDGTEGPRAQGVKQVVFNLLKADPPWLRGCPVAFVDERLSTAAAGDLAGHHRSSRAAKQSGALDALAATVILERALALLRQTASDAPSPL